MERERKEREQAYREREALAHKLKEYEVKLHKGGMMMDKAAKQEYELRQAKIELENRRLQEQELAAELERKEEENADFEERYEDMSDTLEEKTIKLKMYRNSYSGKTTFTHPLTLSRTCEALTEHKVHFLHALGEHELVDGTCGREGQREGKG